MEIEVMDGEGKDGRVRCKKLKLLMNGRENNKLFFKET